MDRNVLYLDCSCGIAGDMLVAALLDVGGNEKRLRQALASLPVAGYHIEVSRVDRAGISCCDFLVALDAVHDGHDHDMAYLHGHDHDHVHAHEYGHSHGHDHDHSHARAHDHEYVRDHNHVHDHDQADSHAHAHRGLREIEDIINQADMSSGARALALKAFTILAQAEAQAHNLPLYEVHFHEVGAVDSIVDIVSAAVLLDDLNIKRVVVCELVDGQGTIRCQHGVIPVPVPATLAICAAHKIPLARCAVEGELVTPTGAALVAALEPSHELPRRYTVSRIGLGAGKRIYSRPSIVRALLIEDLCDAATQSVNQVVKIECDIDDASPEVLAYAGEALRAAGALEVHWLPLYTKKGRPAYQLQVIATPQSVQELEHIVLCETSTIGLRKTVMQRTVLPRTIQQAQTPWGPVRVKQVTLPDNTMRITPEFEDCATIAHREGVPVQQVMDAARQQEHCVAGYNQGCE